MPPWLAVQLLGLWAFMRAFEIESRAFWSRLVSLAFIGASVAYWLPRAWRLRLFAGLSLVAVLGVFGGRDGTALLGIGCFLIAFVHVPIRFRGSSE